MATLRATLKLDRNPAAFQIPKDLPGDQRRLAGILNSTFERINRAFKTLKVAVDGPDTDPSTPVDITVVTGASIVGGQLQLTTATLRVLHQVASANITLGSSVNVHSGNPTASGTTLTFPTKDVFVLSSAAGADSTISGTSCA